MKIESSNNSITIHRPGAVRATNDAEAQGAVGAVRKTDAPLSGSSTVSLSTLPTASDADIDTAQVESIKAALRDGTYTVDSSKIADGMMSNARDLLQTVSR
ncbi:flagellar biosynthesis anti-sigma factor FlgM [Paraburkholderia phymatum]|uniref:Negative regulator of flagellin synthesis n=1 Tax=Paraburkholderia phymatum (strain DSM 17167 / CIP 108236 / LMG 21445 / STM815) TaxID=391038 RepID=B2JR17_PARP8|nr:flagellar biosynthesis anti-sigma factor FlgM [Paraburkholderia phymatum]ACC73708.1 anti-sigma-28 factor, FlgM [Paraburkholderia phymatum STM815]